MFFQEEYNIFQVEQHFHQNFFNKNNSFLKKNILLFKENTIFSKLTMFNFEFFIFIRIAAFLQTQNKKD